MIFERMSMEQWSVILMGETEVLGEKPVLVTLCARQIPSCGIQQTCSLEGRNQRFFFQETTACFFRTKKHWNKQTNKQTNKQPNWLTTRNRILPEKLTGFYLVKKFPAFYGTRSFITVFIRARHLSLSWARSIQSKSISYLLKILFNFVFCWPCIPV